MGGTCRGGHPASLGAAKFPLGLGGQLGTPPRGLQERESSAPGGDFGLVPGVGTLALLSPPNPATAASSPPGPGSGPSLEPPRPLLGHQDFPRDVNSAPSNRRASTVLSQATEPCPGGDPSEARPPPGFVLPDISLAAAQPSHAEAPRLRPGPQTPEPAERRALLSAVPGALSQYGAWALAPGFAAACGASPPAPQSPALCCRVTIHLRPVRSSVSLRLLGSQCCWGLGRRPAPCPLGVPRSRHPLPADPQPQPQRHLPDELPGRAQGDGGPGGVPEARQVPGGHHLHRGRGGAEGERRLLRHVHAPVR